MAAQCSYWIHGHKKDPTHHKLFDTLYDFSKMAPEDCPACGGTRELHVNLDFQRRRRPQSCVCASSGKIGVVAWGRGRRSHVHPFLVVLEAGVEGRLFCWMPFWLAVGKEARYVQHALCLDHAQFQGLIPRFRTRCWSRCEGVLAQTPG